MPGIFTGNAIYRVGARNEAGLGPASSWAAAQGVDVPGPPSNLSVLVLEPGDRFQLSWSPVSDSGLGPNDVSLPLAAYVVEICRVLKNTASTCSFATLFNASYISNQSVGFTTDNVPGGYAYFFRVRAVNVAGLGNISNVVYADAISLSLAPQNFLALVIDPLQINLAWAVPSDTGNGNSVSIPVSAYIINVSTSDNFISSINIYTGTGIPPSTGRTDTGLPPSNPL